MERQEVSPCPACDACPEIEISGEEVRIGEAGNLVLLSREEWNVLWIWSVLGGSPRSEHRWPGRRADDPPASGGPCPAGSESGTGGLVHPWIGIVFARLGPRWPRPGLRDPAQVGRPS